MEIHKGIELNINDCLVVLNDLKQHYDCIVTDPPYEIGLYTQDWDQTGISFSAELWNVLFQAIKPGGFIAAFSAMKLYHKLASAAEAAGFTIYPFLSWVFPQGLPKAQNVSKLFDRDNIKDRQPIGHKTGSGYCAALAHYGAQNYNKLTFPVYEKNVSEEARAWEGYYYGLNAFKPAMEPILLAQRPIARKRMIDNIREFGTGPLYFGTGDWPTTIYECKKARKKDHGSDLPSVKPVPLMEQLCRLVCPRGGLILDPFAGTGTTGIAARNLGYHCHLIEKRPEMEPVIKSRLISSDGPPCCEYKPLASGV